MDMGLFENVGVSRQSKKVVYKETNLNRSVEICVNPAFWHQAKELPHGLETEPVGVLDILLLASASSAASSSSSSSRALFSLCRHH